MSEGKFDEITALSIRISELEHSIRLVRNELSALLERHADLPLEKLGLELGTRNSLKRTGMETIAQVIVFYKSNFIETPVHETSDGPYQIPVRNFGFHRRHDLTRCLREHGYIDNV